MDEQSLNNIRKHLEDESAQQRVQSDILRAREDVTVTIGRAAQLFNFSESQLRDWEGRGFLKPRRSKDDRGQRLYALSELDKLALLKELINGGYAVGTIPLDIDEIWHTISSSVEEQALKLNGHNAENVETHSSIDTLVEEANKGEHWRYFISQMLRIVLSLICEDIPGTVAGIILPIKGAEILAYDLEPERLPEIGECVICWRDQNNAFHTLYNVEPCFAYPSDFRVRGLRAAEEKEARDSTFIVLQRKAMNLSLSQSVVDTVRQLLIPIRQDIETWLPYFRREVRGTVYPTTALGNASNAESMLKFLADMVVRIGGKNNEGKDHWKFCCVLLPSNILQPFQQRNLYVQAQSKNSPHVVDKTIVSPETPILSLSLRAFQSGNVIYRSHVSAEDKTIVYREQESPAHSPVQSAIAFPIGAENSSPLGILYIVSEDRDAFSLIHRRILRLLTRIAEELLAVMTIRQQSKEGLRDIIKKPSVVNKVLEGFYSENRFIRDVESLLRDIKETADFSDEPGVTSFISIDMDRQSSYTRMYGDQLSTNLSKELGERIRNQMGLLLSKQTDYQIYHIYADRFFVLLREKTLDTAREYAEKLQEALQRNYFASVMSPSYQLPVRDRIEFKDVTVRLGVTSYKHAKLYEVLKRFPSETQIADMGFNIFYFLELALHTGKEEGGGRIISWYPADSDHEHGRLAVWPPKV